MDPVRLSRSTLGGLPESVKTPSAEVLSAGVGIVHFGVGAFHRRHQELYASRILEKHGGDWAVLGVGILPEDVKVHKQLQEQDFLYSLLEKSHNAVDATVIGSLRDFVLPFREENEMEVVLSALEADTTKIVTLTVTEKGYLRDGTSDNLLWNHPLIQKDLANPEAPSSAIGFIAAGLERRRRASRKPFTVLSCDNVPLNGKFVKQSVLSLAAKAFGVKLVDYIETEGRFPSTMVDGITPMTYQRDRDWIRDNLSFVDEAPVVSEKFHDWIIEDEFVSGIRPKWEDAGARMVTDVVPFELAKIRLLNVPHSASTYAGYLLGLTYIHEAVLDPLVSVYTRKLMEVDITPTLLDVAGMEQIDLESYRNLLIERFSDPATLDTLERVAQDASSKYANQLVPMVVENLHAGRTRNITLLGLAVATWARHLHGKDETGRTLNVSDGRRDELIVLMQQPDGIEKLIHDTEIFGALDDADIDATPFRKFVIDAYNSICANGVRSTFKATLDELPDK